MLVFTTETTESYLFRAFHKVDFFDTEVLGQKKREKRGKDELDKREREGNR